MRGPVISVLGNARVLKAWRSPPLTLKREPPGLPAPQTIPSQASLLSWQSPVTDQGVWSTCAEHAWCSAAEFLHVRDAHGDQSKLVRLSRFFLRYAVQVHIYCGRPNADQGALNVDVAVGFETYGTCRADLWPDDDTKFSDEPSKEAEADAANRRAVLATPTPSLMHIRASISQGFPCIVGAAIPWSITHDPVMARSGKIVVPTDKDPVAGLHDLLAVAYDDVARTVTVKNSWGLGFGSEGGPAPGYGTLTYDHFGPSMDTPLIQCYANEAFSLRSTQDE